MKILYFFSISVLLFLHGCTQDGNNVGPAGAISTVLTQGNWVLNDFNFGGNDRTYLFGGYKFTFNTNGNVSAVKNTVSAMGTWTSSSVNGQSTMFFDFASTPNFSQLNGNWQSVSITSAQVRLQRTNGSSGGTDNLTLDLF
jgi:hypothetical protein